MKHWKQDRSGQEQEERLDVDPTLPEYPGGGGGLTASRPGTREVQVDDVGLINLSKAPRGEHWIEPDETPTPIAPREIGDLDEDDTSDL